MVETVSTITDLIYSRGLLAVVVILAAGLVWLAVKFYREMNSNKEMLQKEIDSLRDEIATNKKTYSDKLESIIEKIQQALEKSTAVIAQNNEIIKDLKQWREK